MLSYKFSAILSLVVSVYVVTLFFDEGSSDASAAADNSQEQGLLELNKRDVKDSTIVVKWHGMHNQAQEEKEKKLQNNKEPETSEVEQLSLTLNGKQYKVYGIFNSADSPFILLRAQGKESELQKVYLGSNLENQIKLVQLTSDSVTFELGQERKSFNLFERSDNENK
ncbi:hypothetical protein WNE01_07410 [Pseudoalteromonas sp. YIC-468]